MFHSLSREGYRWKRDRPGCPLIAGPGPPSPRGCRSDAERCRPSRDARGRVRRGAALLPDPVRLVPEGPGRQANVSHDVISKIETGERPPAEDFPPRLDAAPELD